MYKNYLIFLIQFFVAPALLVCGLLIFFYSDMLSTYDMRFIYNCKNIKNYVYFFVAIVFNVCKYLRMHYRISGLPGVTH